MKNIICVTVNDIFSTLQKNDFVEITENIHWLKRIRRLDFVI